MLDKWDHRFLTLARHVAGWSKDPSTKCGAVIADIEHRIVSIGFNGFPMGIEDDPLFLANREAKYERMIHAEMNALLFMSSRGEGRTLYTVPFLSCARCAVHVIQAGIAMVVAPPCRIPRWQESIELSKILFAEAGVGVLEVEPEDGIQTSKQDETEYETPGSARRSGRAFSPRGA